MRPGRGPIKIGLRQKTEEVGIRKRLNGFCDGMREYQNEWIIYRQMHDGTFILDWICSGLMRPSRVQKMRAPDPAPDKLRGNGITGKLSGFLGN